MLSDDEQDAYVNALQALDLLHEDQIEAELELHQAMVILADCEEDLRNRTKPLPKVMAHSVLRNHLEEMERASPGREADIATLRAAVTLCEIRETVEAAKKEIAEAGSAPRRSEVADQLRVLAAHGQHLADALKSQYVADAIDRELSLGALPDLGDKRRLRPITRRVLSQVFVGRSGAYKILGHLIGVIAHLADRALERRVPLITEDGLKYGDLYYKDNGGRESTALSIDGLPLKQRFVVRCLKLFGKYRPGVASTVDDR